MKNKLEQPDMAENPPVIQEKTGANLDAKFA
jgi:hypothetical protein